MANIVLPTTLTELFPGAPKRVPVDVSQDGATLLSVLDALDSQFPGMRSRICEPLDGGPRIRRHLVIFVDGERADLADPVRDTSEVRLVPALSGG